MSVSRWDPFRELFNVREEMDRLFERALGRRADRPEGEGERGLVWAPALDIAEEPDAYVVKAELPGIAPADVEVTLEGGLLTITGERRQETETSERQFHRGGAALRPFPPLDHPAGQRPDRCGRGRLRQTVY
jgi:HSP20 family protein